MDHEPTGCGETDAVGLRRHGAVADEYQDGGSAGSLVMARGSWLDLVAAQVLDLPQQFTFLFHSPSRPLAVGLARFLGYAPHVGFVRAAARAGSPDDGSWQVAGTSRPAVWCLGGIEHLFMRLRRAGARYDSTLVSVVLLPRVSGR